MHRIKILVLILGFGSLVSFGQTDKHKELYTKAFNEQLSMLKGEKEIDFKRAVFITENAFHKDSLNYQSFNNEITEIGNKLKNLIKQKGLEKYKTAENWAIFTFMSDSISVNNFRPYIYDFDDFMGEKDWTKMFTTKLMKTKNGNCHSLPYFYKILSQELHAKASLTLAPNHIYIKHIDEKGQWTNVELTNGGFPRDQWIINQMAISVEAIKNEIYMKPLTEKESIALTMFDLASAYEFQYETDKFYLSIIDAALTYFPKCVPLLMCKANYYAQTGTKEQKKRNPNFEILKDMYDKQELVYNQINNLGHKDMPLEIYEQWVQSVENEKQKRDLTKKQ